MRARELCTIALIVGLAGFVSGCDNPLMYPTLSTVSSISVTGTPPAAGSTSQFTAIVTLSDGATSNITSMATWTSSNAAVATVSSAGVVTGVVDGSTTITATYQTVNGSDAIVLTH